MLMKIKNYQWNGFGFPVIFNELPAIKVRGAIIPDMDMSVFARPVIEHICVHQNVPLSGGQVKFIRLYFGLSLREFAKFASVRHQSVMRWESRKSSAAQIDVNTEVVLRLKVLMRLGCKGHVITDALDRIRHIEELRAAGGYKKIEPLRVPDLPMAG